MEYKVEKTAIVDPTIDSAEWNRAQVGRIEVENWAGFYPAPKTTFKLLRGPVGISVLMHTDEKELRSECTSHSDEICADSCMEFFLQPDMSDKNYLNFEINPKGLMHIGIGKAREGRTFIHADRKQFSIDSEPKDGDWTLKFYIPDAFLLTHFKKTDSVCRANFYKCGEKTGHKHYASWTQIKSNEPDFHLSEFFGKIKFR